MKIKAILIEMQRRSMNIISNKIAAGIITTVDIR